MLASASPGFVYGPYHALSESQVTTIVHWAVLMDPAVLPVLSAGAVVYRHGSDTSSVLLKSGLGSLTYVMHELHEKPGFFRLNLLRI